VLLLLNSQVKMCMRFFYILFLQHVVAETVCLAPMFLIREVPRPVILIGAVRYFPQFLHKNPGILAQIMAHPVQFFKKWSDFRWRNTAWTTYSVFKQTTNSSIVRNVTPEEWATVHASQLQNGPTVSSCSRHLTAYWKWSDTFHDNVVWTGKALFVSVPIIDSSNVMHYRVFPFHRVADLLRLWAG
jgi:hypothetical protein